MLRNEKVATVLLVSDAQEETGTKIFDLKFGKCGGACFETCIIYVAETKRKTEF